MKILAIETGSESGSVALWLGQGCEERTALGAQTHSGWVLPAISALMAEAGLDFAGLDAIAFGGGPGAFTGLRLACGVAQGLAFSAARPVVTVGSLEALAWQAGPGSWLVATDARMNELYFAAYRVDDAGVQCMLAPQCEAPSRAVEIFAQFLQNTRGAWAGAGAGFAAYEGTLARGLPGLTQVRSEVTATARAVATLAVPKLAAGQATAPAQATLFYVRDKVARTVAERMAAGGRA